MNLGLHRQFASSAWPEAGRDALAGVAIVARRLVALSGLMLLSAGFVLLASEQARNQVTAAVLAGFSEEAQPGKAEIDPSPAVEVRPGRWSDWLASSPAGRLEPPQENVARYLSRRYRVAEGAVRQIVGAAFSTGQSIGIDPILILAVTAIESSLNPFAQSSVGAQGLMQVMTHVHSEKFQPHGGDHAALDPIANLRVGSEILKDLILRGGSVQRGLQLYVGAGNLPDDGGYAARVLGEYGRIKLAATGDVRSALSAGLRADDQSRGKPSSPELAPAGTGKPQPASGASATLT
jgi:soluble lytic murein transglycosylase-like protein